MDSTFNLTVKFNLRHAVSSFIGSLICVVIVILSLEKVFSKQYTRGFLNLRISIWKNS